MELDSPTPPRKTSLRDLRGARSLSLENLSSSGSEFYEDTTTSVEHSLDGFPEIKDVRRTKDRLSKEKKSAQHSSSSLNNNSFNEKPPQPASESNFAQLAREMMKSDNQDDIKAFLLTYRRFATPTDLYNVWVSFYKQIQDGHKSKKTKELLDKVVNFLEVWVGTYFSVDFNKKRSQEILELLKNLDPLLQNQIKLLFLKGDELYKRSSSSSVFQIRRPSRRNIRPTNNQDLMSIPSYEIAKALTMSEFELLQSVFPTEFLYKIGWQNENKDRNSPNIQRMITRFNEVSFWVSTEILSRAGKNQRAVVEKFIDIAKHCEKLNNFNSLMEIVSGMNNSAVQRLKRLWVSLPEKQVSKFEELEELMMPQNNFRNYYNELNKRPLPTLPYFALFLRDFTFINQGNVPLMTDGKINLDMLRLLGKRVSFVQKFQTVPYKLVVDTATANYISNLTYIDDDEMLYQLSLKSQPSVMFPSGGYDPMLDPEVEAVRASQASSRRSSNASEAIIINPAIVGSIDDLDVMNSYLTDTEDEEEREDLSKEKLVLSDNESGKEDSPDENPSAPTELIQDKDSQIPNVPHGTQIKKTASLSKFKDQAKAERWKRKIRKMLLTQTVHVPDDLVPVFAKAERQIDSYFGVCNYNADTGTIDVQGERMLLLSASFPSDFSSIAPLLLFEKSDPEERELINNCIFDFGYLIGKSDAKFYKTKLGPKPPLSLFSLLGPVLSYSGRAFMEIHPDSVISTDDNFKLHFDLHENAEVDGWMESNLKCEHPTCLMISGYTSGFCTETLGISLVATEILCRAKGDNVCKFIMGTPSRIDELLLQTTDDLKLQKRQRQSIVVNSFMESKKSPRYNLENVATSEETQKAISDARKGNTPKPGERLAGAVPNKLYRNNKTQLDLESKVMRQATTLFKTILVNPLKACISYEGRKDRYMLVRAKSISVDALYLMRGWFGKTSDQEITAIRFASHFLYDWAKVLGAADEIRFSTNTKFQDNHKVERAYCLPIYLQYTGWGKMEISLGANFGNPKLEDFLLKHTLHFSCEADAFMSFQREANERAHRAKYPICLMHSAYCCGWFSRVFGTRLVTVEVACKASGHSCCTFLTSHPERIEEHVISYLNDADRLDDLPNITSLTIFKQQSEMMHEKDASGVFSRIFSRKR